MVGLLSGATGSFSQLTCYLNCSPVLTGTIAAGTSGNTFPNGYSNGRRYDQIRSDSSYINFLPCQRKFYSFCPNRPSVRYGDALGSNWRRYGRAALAGAGWSFRCAYPAQRRVGVDFEN